METNTRKHAGLLIILIPTVVYGGFSLLNLIINKNAGIIDNPLRREFFRAGHAHAGILLILSLVCLLYVDKTSLSIKQKGIVKIFIPLSAIFVPAGFLFSMISSTAKEPTALIYLAYIGALLLVIGLLVLGFGLIKSENKSENH